MTAIDTFSSLGGPALGSPIIGAVVVAPSDTVEFINVTRALYVGVAGDVTALMQDGSVVLFKALPVGIHPLRIRRVNNTATTATNMLGLL